MLGRYHREQGHLLLHIIIILCECGLPGIGQARREMSVQIHSEDYIVALLGRVAPDYISLGNRPDDGDIYGLISAIRMSVASHYRHIELLDGGLQALEDLGAGMIILYGHHVHHRQGSPAHGRYVIHIDQNGEIACEEGIGFDQGLHYSVRGEQDVIITELDGCGILSLRCRNGAEGIRRKESDDLPYGALPCDPGERPYGLHGPVQIHDDAKEGVMINSCHSKDSLVCLVSMTACLQSLMSNTISVRTSDILSGNSREG